MQVLRDLGENWTKYQRGDCQRLDCKLYPTLSLLSCSLLGTPVSCWLKRSFFFELLPLLAIVISTIQLGRGHCDQTSLGDQQVVRVRCTLVTRYNRKEQAVELMKD